MKIIHDMPAAQYHAAPGINKSLLDQVARSPLHARAYLDGVKQDATPAMVFGSAFHSAVLEPEKFASEYAVFDGDRRTKDGKARYEELSARATVISATDHDAITAMAKAIRHHQNAGKLLQDGVAETSVFWEDGDSGLGMKCRADWMRSDGIIVDVKTCEDASPAGFAKSVATYRYHVQAAHYLSGCQADRFLFVAVEKKAPYAVAVYELDADAIAIGAGLRRRDIDTFATCEALGSWPGYCSDITTLSLPSWAAIKEAA